MRRLMLVPVLAAIHGCAPPPVAEPVAASSGSPRCDALAKRIGTDIHAVAVADLRAAVARREALTGPPQAVVDRIMAQRTPNPLREEARRLLVVARQAGCFK